MPDFNRVIGRKVFVVSRNRIVTASRKQMFSALSSNRSQVR